MSHNVLPGITEFDRRLPFGAPPINDTYRETLSNLVLLQDESVTHFYGSMLHLDEDMSVWMSPVEVDDGDSYSYFQVLYVNTTPQEAFHDYSLPVSQLEVDEAGYKLTPADHVGYEQLMSQFSGGRKHVLIRHCNTGMAYYPRSLDPTKQQLKADTHLEKLIRTTGLHEPEVKITLGKPSAEEDIDSESYHIETVHARTYPFGGGEIHSYGVVLDNDPWKYYEIFTARRRGRTSRKNLLVRIDSGCDTGQIYDDRGCDCREQLHTALGDIQRFGDGMVIHVPAQDGRGYGAATKMETEGLKMGIQVATNQANPRPLDTITAAKTLLGPEFDIRTYEGAGRILGALGVESIILQTDNKLKVEGIEAANIHVDRRATNTIGANGSHKHVQAKHEHPTYYAPGEEQK